MRLKTKPHLKQLLLITGMHRSGTSLVTSLCHVFGLDLPANLIPPDRWNPKGYFESSDVNTAQEKLLASLGRSWFDVGPFPDGWLDQVPGRVCLAELRSFIDKNLSGSSILVVKDPRSSLMIPLWTKLADEYGIDLRVLIVVRRPGQVARSLEVRDHMNPFVSLALWWTHTACALREAQGRPNGIAIYEEVLRRPEALFNLLREEVGIIDIPWSAEIRQRALDCADEDLNHVAQGTSTEDIPLMDKCTQLYEQLSTLSCVPPDLKLEPPEELAALNSWFPEWRRLFVKHLAAIDELERLKTLRLELA